MRPVACTASRLEAELVEALPPLTLRDRRRVQLPPTPLMPIAHAEAMNPHVRCRLAFDRQHSAPPNPPLQSMACFASFSLSVELGEFGLPEKFQTLRSRLLDRPLRKHAACPVFLHVVAHLPWGDHSLTLPGCLVKLRDPSDIWKTTL